MHSDVFNATKDINDLTREIAEVNAKIILHEKARDFLAKRTKINEKQIKALEDDHKRKGNELDDAKANLKA